MVSWRVLNLVSLYQVSVLALVSALAYFVVGMTGMTEAVLAREAGLEYASLAVVINHAAGRGDSVQAIKLEELGDVMHQSIVRAVRILTSFFERTQ